MVADGLGDQEEGFAQLQHGQELSTALRFHLTLRPWAERQGNESRGGLRAFRWTLEIVDTWTVRAFMGSFYGVIDTRRRLLGQAGALTHGSIYSSVLIRGVPSGKLQLSSESSSARDGYGQQTSVRFLDLGTAHHSQMCAHRGWGKKIGLWVFLFCD